MCVTSNYLPKVLPVLLICVQYCYSYKFLKDVPKISSVKGNFISLSEDQVLFQIGEAPEILCTGENADNLTLYSVREFGSLLQLPVDALNTTTIRFKVKKTEIPTKMSFYCKDQTVFGLDPITLLFDGPPDLRNFHCMSKNLIFLNCTWNTTNIQAGFNLYVLNDQPSKICNIPVHEVSSDLYDLSCIWDRNRTPRYTPDVATLHLVMEYCNYTHCFNKTYDYNHLSIVKLDPPKLNLGSIWDGNYGKHVDVGGRIPSKTFDLLDGVNYRVELWSFPNRQESIGSESIMSNGNHFLIQAEIPCYGQKYELRVSVMTRQATEEEFWSDYSSVTFKTEEFVGKNGEKCKERKFYNTPDIMLYELNKFRMKFKEEQSQLEREIEQLNARAAKLDH